MTKIHTGYFPRDDVEGWTALLLLSIILLALPLGCYQPARAISDEYGCMTDSECEEQEDVVVSHWAASPNTSKCGWNCINRIPTEGESWEGFGE